MNKLIGVLLVLLVLLQFRLWVGEGSLAHLVALKREMTKQTAEIEVLLERNRILQAEVMALKQGTEMIEEKARGQLGMIKDGETFYMFAD